MTEPMTEKRFKEIKELLAVWPNEMSQIQDEMYRGAPREMVAEIERLKDENEALEFNLKSLQAIID